MTTSNGIQERERVIYAVEEVFRTDPTARQFLLRVLTDKVELQSYGWSVPVASGATSGSAYELARAIEHAQEIAENNTRQDLSLYLDAFGV